MTNLQEIIEQKNIFWHYNVTLICVDKLKKAEESEHPFMKPEDEPIVEKWMRESISE